METTKIPDSIEDGLRGILGIPRNRIEALRLLVRELRACRALAVAADADYIEVLLRLDSALDGAVRDRDRAESHALAAAAYTPEVF